MARASANVFSICLGVAGLAAGMASATQNKPRKIDFNRDVRPIISNHCFRCHGPDAETVAAGLRLDSFEGATQNREGRFGIVPGKLDKSLMWGKVSNSDPAMRMPPPDSGVKPLSKEQIETLRLWIEQGAEYKAHWAFVAPKMPALPKVKDTKWVRNDIDRFILAKLEEEGMTPEPEADKATLLRRASLALTGLPPTPDVAAAFLKDKDPKAYEKAVDRLLASPKYGEHEARYWLDAVRYGDTHGLHLDNERLVWPYRDWVVRSMNADLPYDKFVTWQLAGDLLPNPTTEQMIATGYVRMNPTTAEGGAIEAEFQAKNTFDRVDTTSTVFLGLTMACARCHDHKYDPLKQREYYEMFAFFNSTADRPLDDNALLPEPVYPAATPEQDKLLVAARTELRKMEDQVKMADALAWITASRLDPPMVGSWEIAGPYEAANFDEAFSTVYPPEKEGEAVEWKASEVTLGQNKENLVNKTNAAVYVRGSVESSMPRPIDLIIASDDGVRVWLNGALVHDNKILRALGPTDKVRLNLVRGKNVLLVKLVNAGGGDGLQLQLGDDLAKRIEAVFQAKEKTPELEREARRLFLNYGPDSEAAKLYRDRSQSLEKMEAMLPRTLIARELPEPRKAFILKRGEYSLPQEEVHRGVPAALGAFPKDAPMNRLGLAEWMVDPKNPLTARVIVNRAWQQHFGIGIVRTSEDFGNQGEWPSHPELLDYLAVRFVKDGWSMKKLHRMIVTSAAFRQRAGATEEKRTRDPENRLIARGPRFRLDAEVIRDDALFASGLLRDNAGGHGFKPFQPSGLWEAIAYPTSNTSKYMEDKGPEVYGRSLYLFWKRTSPPPSMTAFDAPSREACTVRRSRTNTPAQALVTLNEPMFQEAARVLAERVIKSADDDSARLDNLFQLTLSRSASTDESAILLASVARYRAKYAGEPDSAKKLLSVGASRRDTRIAPEEHAAWMLLAQTLMNTDEFLTLH
jgi:cytochrome c553